MSIYSGFATRQQQQTYDQCLQTVLYIMQRRLLKFYKGQSTDQDKFINLLNKLHSQMKSMESHKYLQPKSSRTFDQLLIFLKNKQIQQASMIPNKIAQVQQISDSELHKKLPIPKSSTETQKSQGKSQRLQIKFNQHNLADKQQQLRPNTTNTRIRKRMSSKSNSSNPNAYHQSNMSSRQPKQEASAASNEPNIQKLKLNNICTDSASKLIKMSRNEQRSYFNNSHQQLATRHFSHRSRGKQSQEQVQQLNINLTNLTGKQSDVHQLIKGYINKTKKSYLKGFNKRKQQIQDMLKQI